MPDGTYDVAFQALGANGVVAFAKDFVTIDQGQTIIKTLQCNFDTGKLAVKIECCNSPAPTTMPSGGASATPTPVPTPFNPASLMSLVYGFEVDATANIYLSGADLGASNDVIAGDGGCLVVVPKNSGIAPYTAYTTMEASYDLEISGNTLAVPNTSYGTGAPGASKRFNRFFDITDVQNVVEFAGTAVQIDARETGTVSVGPSTASPTDPRTGLWVANTSSSGGMIIKPAADYPNTGNILNVNVTTAGNARSMYFRGANDPIWTSGKGIVARTSSTTVSILATPPVGHSGAGFVGLESAMGDRYFVTLDGDRNIYEWNSTTPNALVPLSPNPIPDGSFPRFINRAPDGSYYVLTFKDGTNTAASEAWGTSAMYGASHYKVMRFEVDTAGNLTYDATQVATY